MREAIGGMAWAVVALVLGSACAGIVGVWLACGHAIYRSVTVLLGWA